MKLNKYIAVILSLAIIISTPFLANAVGIIGGTITDISGMNRFSVSVALNAYFNSRESFLLNQANTIDVLLAGIEDEVAHRERYALKGIDYVGSAISIDNIISGDTYADAVVTETVTYVKDGVTNTTIVTHKLLLALNEDNAPAVVYDGYYEVISDFRSCSYVDESNVDSINTLVGSGSCIVHVAEGEVGYTEGTDGYTKYGEWYTSLFNPPTFDYTYSTWCVMFVVWCAAQAQIPASIIAHKANQTEMLNFFNGLGRYHSRITAVNDWAPETGDLVFFSKDRVQASHIGIVRYVDANYIYVVHGNNSQGQVALMTVARTNDWIFGYAKPAYSNAHAIQQGYSWDATFHWKECAACGYTVTKTRHTFVQSGIGGPFICSDCGYTRYGTILGLPTIPDLPFDIVKE